MIRFSIIAVLVTCCPIFSMDKLSVSDYLDYLINDHAIPKQLQTDVRHAQSSFIQSSSVADWTIQSSLSSNHTEPYQSSFAPEYIDSLQAQLSIARPLLSTGGYLSFDIRQQRFKQAPLSFGGMPSVNQPTYFQNAIAITYKQPLLVGFLGDVVNHPINIASRNVQATKFKSEDGLEAFVQSKLSEYVDWTLLHELTELSFSRLQLARESYDQTKERVRVNLAENIDLLRAEAALERAHQLWMTQKANLKSFQFKVSVQFETPSILHQSPSFQLYDMVDIKKPDHILISKLRRITSMNLNEPTLKENLRLSKAKRNGELDLVGSYEFLGGSSAFYSAQRHLNNNATIALQYRRALSDTQAIEQVKKENDIFKQFKHQQTQIQKDIKAEVLSLYTLIEEYRSILNITLNQILIFKKKADAETALYKQGRSSIDMVIQAQDDVLNSKLNYANLSANYQKYVLAYQDLTDALLQAYEITL